MRTKRLDRKEVERLMGGDGQGGVFTWREKNSRKVCKGHHLSSSCCQTHVLLSPTAGIFRVSIRSDVLHSLRVTCSHYADLFLQLMDMTPPPLAVVPIPTVRCSYYFIHLQRVDSEPSSRDHARPFSVSGGHPCSCLYLLLRLVVTWGNYV